MAANFDDRNMTFEQKLEFIRRWTTEDNNLQVEVLRSVQNNNAIVGDINQITDNIEFLNLENEIEDSSHVLRNNFKQLLFDEKLSRSYNPEHVFAISLACRQYDGILESLDSLGQQRQNLAQPADSLEHANTVASVALELLNAFDMTLEDSRNVIRYFRPFIDTFRETCQNKPFDKFDKTVHSVDKNVKLPITLLRCLERAEVDKKTIWSLMSSAIFGSCQADEAFKLLVASTLLEFEAEFRALLQSKVFPSKPDFLDLLARFDCECKDAKQFYLQAFSLAIRHPVYCYGSFEEFGQFSGLKLPGTSNVSLYDVAKAIYETAIEFEGHCRYVGFEVDDVKEPISIFIDEMHYCVIRPKIGKKEVKLWKPKTLAFDYFTLRND